MATTEVAGRTIARRAAEPAGALTQQLLDGPIVPTLLRLAAPNVVVIAVQAVVSAAEAMYVGWLGAEALAGVALVFPLIMLMQTMSAGGMGGGVASAVARAVGAGRRPEAEALAVARGRHRARHGRAVHARLSPGWPRPVRRHGGHRQMS